MPSQEVPKENPTDNNGQKAAASAKLLLSVLQKENDIEIDRKKTFDTRAGILVGLCGVLLTIFTKNIDFSLFQAIPVNRFYLFALFFAFFFLLPLSLTIIALISFTRVIITREYNRIGLNGFNSVVAQNSEEASALLLIDSYREVVELNGQLNERKAFHLKNGIYCLSISICLMTIMYLLSITFK